MTVSLVMIVAVADLSAVDALALRLGYGPGEFTVRLSPTGAEPATHVGLHAWASEITAAVWTSAPIVPPLSGAETTALRALLLMSARVDLLGIPHFDEVAAGHGLVRILTSD